MGISIIFISTALVLYTASIFIEKWLLRHLENWIICLFAGGFISDLIGTSLMFLQAENKFSLTTHSFCGYLALLIMFIHLSWAILAHKKVWKFELLFTKFSIYAWLIWMVAFLSGIPKMG
ncbi:MAG: HsmA family protein [Candidatus Paceibacterota bacterium]